MNNGKYLNHWCYLTMRYVLIDGHTMTRRLRIFVKNLKQLEDKRIVNVEIII